MPDEQKLVAFWAKSSAELLAQLETSAGGLSSEAAQARLRLVGPNLLEARKRQSVFGLFLDQFKSPISLILLAAAVLSFFLNESTDAIIILTIIFVSSLLSFWQEKNASQAMQELLSIVESKTQVVRAGKEQNIPSEKVVPGDIVRLQTGDLIPADSYILESNSLFVNEATLTGETYPVAKSPEPVAASAVISQRSNGLFMGTHVVSGSGTAVVVQTGNRTELGRIAQRITSKPPETDFEHGIRQFGYLLMEATLVLVILIFAINVGLQKPVLEAFLFSLAIAVGLTPQLLPAIISINLAKGAGRMAKQQVIVKRLAAIENFGSMNVLCFDKTGTLTEGAVKADRFLSPVGQPSAQVQQYAVLNATLQQGFQNPIDAAIAATAPANPDKYQYLGELPYDFYRKRLTIMTLVDGQPTLITKGAVENVLAVCMRLQTESGLADLESGKTAILETFRQLSEQGFRTLGVATKAMPAGQAINAGDESDMIFQGFITLYDPPKADIGHTIAELKRMGVELKMITGDNALVAASVARQIGIDTEGVLTGRKLRQLSPEALRRQVIHTHVFAEIEPNQKESIILALKKAKYVVGYMGDGINDSSALHAADVGISVESAVSVAKESAEIVLLQQDLNVLLNGVLEGRRTFVNTMKYIFMATSANFGNMFSMAGASVFLPFLPLLPTQILLTNLLTDLPEITIASDQVEDEAITQPTQWNLAFIRRFMMVFGLLSSVFDYLSFGVLIWIFRAREAFFQTGWFVESVVSASLIVLVVRTRRPFFSSRPGRWLLITTLSVAAFVLLLPFTPLAALFGFVSLPLSFYGAVLVIVTSYIVSAELLKQWFYKHLPIVRRRRSVLSLHNLKR